MKLLSVQLLAVVALMAMIAPASLRQLDTSESSDVDPAVCTRCLPSVGKFLKRRAQSVRNLISSIKHRNDRVPVPTDERAVDPAATNDNDSDEAMPPAQDSSSQFYQAPGISACAILRGRGYLAEEHYTTTPDGYILQLTRGTNPLINGGKSGLAERVPILFVHGAFSSANLFVVNSFDASPSDLSRTDANKLGIDYLKQVPSSKALPLLAMDFGHEVWLVNRRAAPGAQRRVVDGQVIGPEPVDCFAGDVNFKIASNSMGAVNYTRQLMEGILQTASQSVNESQINEIIQGLLPPTSSYFKSLAEQLGYSNTDAEVSFSSDTRSWNFTLDPQIEFDVPQVVDYVLKQTGRQQLAIVAHSAGGAITLSALATHPDLSSKISRAIFWSEALNLGINDSPKQLYPLVEPILKQNPTSFPVPAYLTNNFQEILGVICKDETTQSALCNPVVDLIVGPSNNTEPFTPEIASSFLFPSCTLEFAQSLQSVKYNGTAHKFDYGTEGNQAAYGQDEPPAYDIGLIQLENMSFYAAAQDALVSPEDIQSTVNRLNVPANYHLINTTFNHQGYFYHRDVAELAVIPALIEIQQSN